MSIKKTILMLYSGGADSVLMYHWALSMDLGVDILMFKYGQKHVAELAYAEKSLKIVRDKFGGVSSMNYIMDISGAFQNTSSNLLKGKKAQFYDVHNAHVPARNLIFISTAMSLAESFGIREIWIGSDYSDRENLFPDCYQEWIIKLNELSKINGSYPITIKAPLLGMHKDDVLSMLKSKGYKTKDIHSGYDEPTG